MALRSRWIVDKEEAVARGGMVVAKDPLAAEAGTEMLRSGGNAVDAAVAMGFAISVVEPMMTTIAGCGLMLVHEGPSRRDWAVEYPPRAPHAATAGMFEVLGPADDGIALYRVRDGANESGYLSATVPATTAGLCLAHERFGRLPLQQVMEPAIHYATEGFPVNWYLSLQIGGAMDQLRRFPASAAVFLPGGVPATYLPQPARIVQKDLADTLGRIAREGRAGFYAGEVAHAIEDDMRRGGGLINAADLDAYQAEVKPPLSASYRGYELLFPTAPCGAWTAVETLNILESLEMDGAGHNSAESLHRFVEAVRLAFADRYFYLGDPDVQPVPLQALLSKEYAKTLASQLELGQATPVGDTEPWVEYARRAVHDPWPFDAQSRPADVAVPSHTAGGDCTTHFGVIDRERNAVSCTQTAVGLFGSKVITPGVGALYTNGMIWFNPVPGTANSIAGWKRPLTNMTPLLLKRDGEIYLSVGAPGGRKIINCNTQVVMNIVDYGMGIQEAIAAPRVDASGSAVLVDSRLDPEVVVALQQRGHSVQVVEETPAATSFATPLGVLADPRDGLLHGGVDVYRIAEARGVD